MAPEGPFLNPSPAPRGVAICPTNGFVSTFFPNIYHLGALCLEWPRPAEQRLPGRYKVAKVRLVANSATRCQLALVRSIAPRN